MGYVARKVRTRWVVDTAQGPRRAEKGTPGARAVKEKSREWYGFWYEEGGGGAPPQKRSIRFKNCREKAAAKVLLSEHLKRLVRRKAGLEVERPAAAAGPVEGHLQSYLADLRKRGKAARYASEVERQARRVLDGVGARSLADLDAGAVQRFIDGMSGVRPGSREPFELSARARETYRQAVAGFTRWLSNPKKHKKGQLPLPADPLAGLEKYRGEAVRRRRALDPGELQRLLDAARERPLHNARLIGRGGKRLEAPARLPAGQVERLRLAGLGRALLYKLGVCLLSRYGALRLLRVDWLFLDAAVPHIYFEAGTVKARRDVVKPLKPELVADLRAWLALTGKRGRDRVFDVPAQMTRELRKDLAFAGIPHKDGAGRTVDFHALKTSGVTAFRRAGLDAGLLQHHAEHRDGRTTERYDDVLSRPADDLFRATPELR
jgi:integrase